jgi:hypothetical protein
VGSELFGNLFEITTKVRMSKSVISEMSADDVQAMAAFFAESLTPPGHMQKDVAKAYMAKIVNLFGMDEVKVRLAVAAWAAVHDVGSVQDFSTKPPVVCGTKEVAASEIFGSIIPVTAQGEPRQFCAVMFEEDIDTILKVFPQVATLLASRCAEAGLPTSDPKAVITFIRGVTPQTMGGNVARSQAKNALLLKNNRSAGGGGAAKVAELNAARAIETAGVPDSGHQLW